MRRMRAAMPVLALLTVVSWAAGLAMATETAERSLPDCRALDLAVAQLSPPPTAYLEFCQRRPDECRMRGAPVVAADAGVVAELLRVNRAVNAEIRVMPDVECSGEEDRWDYPDAGVGDCEDIALEKRRRLVAGGLPRAALTMAIVLHRDRWFSHAVLLAETTAGSFVLDSLDDTVQCWDRVPYHFETRERIDGAWSRFDQRPWWTAPREAAASAASASSPASRDGR